MLYFYGMKALLSALSLLHLASCTINSDDNRKALLQDTTDTTYKVGQVWRYKTRPSEEKSTFTVVKIERSSTDTICHVYIDGLNLQTNEAGTKFSETISHSPFSKSALDSSKTKLERTITTLPVFEEGYQIWRKSYLAGEGGVYNVPVNQSLEFTEQTILDGQQAD